MKTSTDPSVAVALRAASSSPIRWLSAPLKKCLYVGTFCILGSFYFATWNETRVWEEWSVPFALLATVELEGVLSKETC